MVIEMDGRDHISSSMTNFGSIPNFFCLTKYIIQKEVLKITSLTPAMSSVLSPAKRTSPEHSPNVSNTSLLWVAWNDAPQSIIQVSNIFSTKHTNTSSSSRFFVGDDNFFRFLV